MRVGWRGKAVELKEWMAAERPVQAERTAMVGGRAWVALLLALSLAWASAGCSSADAVKAATEVHAYLPVVSGLAQDAMAIAAGLDPQNVQLIQQVSLKVQGDLAELESLSGAYVANPTADGWTRVLAVVDQMVNDSDNGLLSALAIKDPKSQMEAKVALSALDAAIHVLDGYLASAKTPAQVQASAAARAVKVSAVSRMWSERDRERVESALGKRVDVMVEAASEAGY
jgi:hypothetical protein